MVERGSVKFFAGREMPGEAGGATDALGCARRRRHTGRCGGPTKRPAMQQHRRFASPCVRKEPAFRGCDCSPELRPRASACSPNPIGAAAIRRQEPFASDARLSRQQRRLDASAFAEYDISTLLLPLSDGGRYLMTIGFSAVSAASRGGGESENVGHTFEPTCRLALLKSARASKVR